MAFSEIAQVLAGIFGGQGVAGQALKSDELVRKNLAEGQQSQQKFLLSELFDQAKEKRKQSADLDLFRIKQKEEIPNSVIEFGLTQGLTPEQTIKALYGNKELQVKYEDFRLRLDPIDRAILNKNRTKAAAAPVLPPSFQEKK